MANFKSKTMLCVCNEVKGDIYNNDGHSFKNTKNGMSRCKCEINNNTTGKRGKSIPITNVVLTQRSSVSMKKHEIL